MRLGARVFCASASRGVKAPIWTHRRSDASTLVPDQLRSAYANALARLAGSAGTKGPKRDAPVDAP